MIISEIPAGSPFALNALGTLELLSATGGQAFNYPQGDTLRMRVSDADRNVSATAADTVTVSVSSAKETTAETVVLTETGVNTGVFSASMSFDPTGAVAADGAEAAALGLLVDDHLARVAGHEHADPVSYTHLTLPTILLV